MWTSFFPFPYTQLANWSLCTSKGALTVQERKFEYKHIYIYLIFFTRKITEEEFSEKFLVVKDFDKFKKKITVVFSVI